MPISRAVHSRTWSTSGPGTEVVGVVVAGGRGERLGLGIPKALVKVGGITLLERARMLLHECCDEVLVAAPTSLDLPVPGALRVADVPGLNGPLAGVVGALQARPNREAFVLGVDFPLMRASTVRAIATARGDAMVALPAPGGVLQPLAAAYGPDAGEAIARNAAETQAITRAVKALGALVIPEDEIATWEGGIEVFLNVNTPADLAEAERRLLASGDRADARRSSRGPAK